MIGRRARLLTDRDHRSADRWAHDIFEGYHPAVDDRQAGANAAHLDVAAQARAASEIQRETAPAHREMVSFDLKSTGDVVAVILQTRISDLCMFGSPTTGAAKAFAVRNSVTAKAAALELRGGRGTRWDRVRLNRLIGSIPVAPTLALAGPCVTRHKGSPARRSLHLRARSPPGRPLTPGISSSASHLT